MSRYWNEIPQYSQPGAEELRRKSAETKKKEKAKGKLLEPVVIQGRQIVRSWWGKAWCENLERYADYESRLDRGKRYVRTGAVIDLKIKKSGNRQQDGREEKERGCRKPLRSCQFQRKFHPFPGKGPRCQCIIFPMRCRAKEKTDSAGRTGAVR